MKLLSAPLNVHWEITNACNLDCTHCYQQDDVFDEAPPSVENLLPIADRIIEAGVFELTLTGGEIFLIDGISRLIGHLNASGIAPHVTTNGTLVTHELIEELSRVECTVQVSIDSATSAIHDRLRRTRGSHAAALRGLQLLTSGGIRTFVSYTETGINPSSLDEVIELVGPMGTDRICAGDVLPTFGTSERRAMVSTTRSVVTTAPTLRWRSDLPEVQLVDRPDRRAQSPCTAMLRDVAILHDGGVYPCPFVRSPAQRLGTLPDESLVDLWRSGFGAKFRSAQRRGHLACINAGQEVPVTISKRRRRRFKYTEDTTSS